jgi:hypothetical protein
LQIPPGTVEYAVRGFLDGLREQIAEIRKFQLDVIWRNYVNEAIQSLSRITSSEYL